jgi:hypothetical protein
MKGEEAATAGLQAALLMLMLAGVGRTHGDSACSSLCVSAAAVRGTRAGDSARSGIGALLL